MTSHFHIVNDSGVPVHVALSTAGVVQYCKNDVAPKTDFTWTLNDAIWHDLTVIPSNGQNKINVRDNNAWKIAEIVVGSAGVLAAAGAAPFTGGASLAIAAAAIGGVVAVGTTVVSLTNFFLHPAAISNLYAPDGYDVDIQGGNLVGHMNGGEFIATGFNPIVLQWRNHSTKSHGTVTAPK
ncbi:hypothetical protein [Mesorhizobium sp. B2-6-2]|uniref:hypothetical protein n=1 Tax=Mesorhizobium sp. B2-6-2 TaxID=2589915 RepID=UPI00112D4EB9|nr:hypothetical protein [Mesorhizobium sp. B2-6-2]TPJ77216.1 hypothetical protein FJ419_17050 [Mesorhizobium sp. B2-6-2]